MHYACCLPHAGLLDAVKATPAATNQQVSDVLTQAQGLLDQLEALPASVGRISRTIRDAIELLRDNFREASG